MNYFEISVSLVSERFCRWDLKKNGALILTSQIDLAPAPSDAQAVMPDWTGEAFTMAGLLVSRGFLRAVEPEGELRLQVGREFQDQPDFFACLEQVSRSIANTHQARQRVLTFRHRVRNGEGLLFVSFDDLPGYQQIFEACRAKSSRPIAQHIFKVRTEVHLDPETKAPIEKFVHDPITVEAILDLVEKSRASKIITCNLNIAQRVFNAEEVLVVPVMEALGVEWIEIDADIYECIHSYSFKKLTDSGSLRLSSFPHYHRQWDRISEIKNVRYVPTNFIPEKIPPLYPLRDDYEIFITSHSGLKYVREYFRQVLWISERLDERCLFYELQLWYHSMRKKLFSSVNIHPALLDAVNQRLFYWYYSSLLFLKFELFDGLRTSRKIHIFGDKHWDYVLPHLYSGTSVPEKEITSFAKEGRFINILMNHSFSYFSLHPIYFYALTGGFHFLCPKNLGVPSDWDGFDSIGYLNSQDLDQKIEAIREIYSSSRVELQRARLKEIHQECLGEIAAWISAGYRPTNETSSFEREALRAEQAADVELLEFSSSHKNLIDESMEKLLKWGSFEMGDSKFSRRPFFERLRKIF